MFCEKEIGLPWKQIPIDCQSHNGAGFKPEEIGLEQIHLETSK